MEFLLFWLVFCGIAAAIASNKGRSAVGFFVLSIFISPLLGILIALVSQPNTEAVESKKLSAGDARKCPFCAELIKAEATVCRYCGREMPWKTVSGNPRLAPREPANVRAAQDRARASFALPPSNPGFARVEREARPDIYLHLNDQQEGPFCLHEIQSLWDGGGLNENSIYWKEGMAEWRPVTELI